MVGLTVTENGIELIVNGHAIPAPVPFTTQGPGPVRAKLITAGPPEQIVAVATPPMLIEPPGGGVELMVKHSVAVQLARSVSVTVTQY